MKESRTKHLFLSIFAATLMMLSCITFVTIANEENESYSAAEHVTTLPSGWIGVYTADDLKKIGNDDNYPLDGKYMQMGDIDFTNQHDSVTKIQVISTINTSGNAVISLKYLNASDTWSNITPSSTYPILMSYSKSNSFNYTSTTNMSISATFLAENDYMEVVIAGTNSVIGSFYAIIDLDCNQTTTTEIDCYLSMAPIGMDTSTNIPEEFIGSYDGNNYKISNMCLSRIQTTGTPVINYSGLFAFTNGATISNMNMENCLSFSSRSISRTIHTGIIAAYAVDTTFSNCNVQGAAYSFMLSNSSTAYDMTAGGIAGHSIDSYFVNCMSSATISTSAYVNTSGYKVNLYGGGIVGYALGGTLSDCINDGLTKTQICRITATGITVNSYMGGIVGYAGDSCVLDGLVNEGTLAVNTGSVATIGTYHAGGVAGCVVDSNVENCINTSDLILSFYSLSYFGGVIGNSDGSTVINCINEGEITSEYTESVSLSLMGGVIGRMVGVAKNCTNYGSVTQDRPSAQGATGGVVGSIGRGSQKTTSIALVNFGDVYSSHGNVGGVGGSMSYFVDQCYNEGSVTSSAGNVGGVFGHIQKYGGEGMLSNSFNRGNIHLTTSTIAACAGGIVGAGSTSVTLVNCYNTGQVTIETGDYAGGIIGNITNVGSIYNCYFLTGSTVDDKAVGYGYAQNSIYLNGTGYLPSTTPDVGAISTMQMATQNTFYTGTTEDVEGWDFTDIWYMEPDAPALKATIEDVAFTSEHNDTTAIVGKTLNITVETNVNATIAVTGASWLSVSGNIVSGVPNAEGTFMVTLTASASNGTTATQTFTIVVVPALVFGSSPAAGYIIIVG